jgi:5-methylcytosine-specific restriction endonuclease McrA
MAKEWTNGRLKSFITSGLRSMFRRWPPKFTILGEAKRGKKINPKSGRLAEHFECSMCKSHYPAKEVQVDHIDPVVDPVIGFVDWNTFIDRLLCPKENLQVLCKECHKLKTQDEKKRRIK